MTAPFRIERLAKQERQQFDCGVESLNAYLIRQASQDERRHVAACYLLIDQDSDQIAGYYTLSAGSVLLGNLPEATAHKLPRYPAIPVVRLGRLAVARSYQRRKLGSVLLFDAIERSSASGIGAFAIVVDAKDDAAARFYRHHGFIPLKEQPRILFLPISDGLRRSS